LSDEAIISEELKNLVNVPVEPDVYKIEEGMVKKFVEAIDDPNPKWKNITPPTFAAALVPNGLLHRILNAKGPLQRLLNGASELEYFQPIKVGDIISVKGCLTRLRQTSGKEGTSLFIITEVTYTNQRGEVVVKGRNTYVKY
jgi:hydroxyacyl-ACP dehydratase HTD2-like protein with hotdog domain